MRLDHCSRVDTVGSSWWLDDDAGQYLRLPRNEAPRERPEWSDARAGVLQDAVWHPMVAWRIGAWPNHPAGCSCPICPGLIIDYIGDDGPDMAWAPKATLAVMRAR